MKKILGLTTAVLLAGGAWAGGDYHKGDKSGDKSTDAQGASSDSMQSDPMLGTGVSETETSVGGSGTAGTTGTGTTGTGTMATGTTDPMAGSELSGKVVRVEANKLYIEHMGAIVPLKVNASTKFDDPSIKRAKDLKEGQEIRANFKVENKTDNLATSISPGMTGTGGSGMTEEPGQGGSGTDVDSSATDINSGSMPVEPESSQPLPEEPGTAVPSPTY